jgi:hypothetical protein
MMDLKTLSLVTPRTVVVETYYFNFTIIEMIIDVEPCHSRPPTTHP